MPPRRRSIRKDGAARAAVEPSVSPAPRGLVVSAFFASFALPNLVTSGPWFYNGLHLMKWTVTLAPLALLGVVAGVRLLRFGPDRTGFRLDGFALAWLGLVLFVSVQPAWAGIRSWPTFFREWFFFASLWLSYALVFWLTNRRLVRGLIWGALVNAALSVVFAELQVRGLHEVLFLVMPAPGHYIANTGQANMLALWTAMAGLGGAFLFLSSEGGRLERVSLACLTGVVFWGLISSASRSGILSFVAGFVALAAWLLRLEGRVRLKGIAFVALLFAAVLAVNTSASPKNAARLVDKVEDMVTNPLSIANRDGIWATSWTMFASHPLSGLGLGQFKWHYIDAANEMLRRWPGFKRQYTHWAHNEFLQWMAEGGLAGAALLFFLWGWWAWGAARAFVARRMVSPEAVWGSAMVVLFGFNALWTRPFHRIENAVWLALAFAVTNRELLGWKVRDPSAMNPPRDDRGERPRAVAYRLLGGVVCSASLAGLLYLADGIRADRLLFVTMSGVWERDVAESAKLFDRACESPMIRDEAERERAYFIIHLADVTHNARLLAEGLKDMKDYFEKQPHEREMFFLRDWALKLGDEDFLNYMESFFGPETSEDERYQVESSR